MFDPQPAGLGQQLRRAIRLPAEDRNYGRYLILRVAMVVANYSLPFYAVYARRELDAREDTVGVYLVVMTLTGVLANLSLGRLADRRGNRLLVRLSAVTLTLPPAVALLVSRLPMPGLDRSLVLALVFLVQGLHTAAYVYGSLNYLLELAPPDKRALYVGFAHGVIGLAFLTLPLGGLIVDSLGFEALFALSLVAGLVSIALSFALEEPRTRRPVPTGSVATALPRCGAE